MEPILSPQSRLILVCGNTKGGTDEKYCWNRGSADLHAELKEYVKEKGLQKKVRIVKSGCLDYCGLGPIVCIEPEHQFYKNVSKEDLAKIKKRWIDELSFGQELF
jgi:NADP-reducing hydrogenase subunit HndC